MSKTIWIIALAMLVTSADKARLLAASFEVGQSFPELVLPKASDRSPLSIASFRGHKTLLHIFASW